jgi:hypothetical protein
VNTFQAERETLAGKLTAAGVPDVTLDPRAPLPCVLVDAPTVIAAAGRAGWETQFPIQILSPPPGSGETLTDMLDRLEAVLRTVGGVPATPGTYPRGDDVVPAYTVTVTRTVANPDC